MNAIVLLQCIGGNPSVMSSNARQNWGEWEKALDMHRNWVFLVFFCFILFCCGFPFLPIFNLFPWISFLLSLFNFYKKGNLKDNNW